MFTASYIPWGSASCEFIIRNPDKKNPIVNLTAKPQFISNLTVLHIVFDLHKELFCLQKSFELIYEMTHQTVRFPQKGSAGN